MMNENIKIAGNQSPAFNCRVMSGLVTTGYLVKLFKRNPLTIHLWIKNRNLPYVSIPGDERPAIRYGLEEVRKWARDHGQRMYMVSDVEVVV